jgi:hypothetical protein
MRIAAYPQQSAVGWEKGEEEVGEVVAQTTCSPLEVRLAHLEHTVYQLLDLTERLYLTTEKLYTMQMEQQKNITEALRQKVQPTPVMMDVNAGRSQRSG